MNNEYDYSGLYHNQPGSTPPTGGAQPGGYPNVGSRGMNTANTARTDYSAADQTGYQQGNPAQNGGYTSSFGGNANGYSYTSAPPQPPQPPKRKGGTKKVLLRVAACVGVAALGFGGGFAGAVVAAKTGFTSGQVVVQQVTRPDHVSTQGSADGVSLSVQEISAIVQPSVVAITTEKMVSANTWFGGSYVQSGAGSGVIISEDGYLLTCAHVVNGASNIIVQMYDDTKYNATLIGADTTSDIAVLKIDATGLSPAVIGDSDALAIGEDAIAVGNPLGTLGGSVTNGIVSALNREVKVQNNNMTLIQTNAAISPGNSGGGLFNGNGELIGIVNAKSTYSDAEGLGFAIPINTAMNIGEQLISEGFVARPVLGISVYTVSDSTTAQQLGVTVPGVYVVQVNQGSGAENAGVQKMDRIIAVDDVAVRVSSDLTDYLKKFSEGDTVTLQVEREGKILSLPITLGINHTKAEVAG